MCRILFVESNKENIETVYSLIDALVKASQSDNTYGETPTSHQDGFGYVLFGKNGEKLSQIYTRSTSPIFESPLEIRIFKDTLARFEKFAFGFHVRKKSAGEVNLINTHPYMFSLPNGINLFFMHNGTLDKPRIMKEFLIELPNVLSDSFTFSYILSRNFENLLSLKELLKNGVKFVMKDSGFNTITLILNGSKLDAIITAYYTGKKEYYKAYLIEEKGLTSFMSSTLKQYLDDTIKRKLKVIGEEPFLGTLITVENLLSDNTSITKEQFLFK
ncbi:class II glutamine amidotransferase [Caldisericum exile]|uniref:Glutamine amidotransferase type-2 domain-containing protein n=1 Tax=Caldisericum exile (strain DSM 21853 / NBRC 104410 / AZM16c01) TaxID=511051 RepID=A0A7U6GFG3_CALEA|nr:class II glutamine amidotransferase [Caldisericum exile]BAL81437.1 hypothetical protein CSE_13110 [Caldisericum exile AZM16c01]